MKDKLNPKEALVGFVGWLTSCNEKTVLSSTDDAANPINMIEKFAKANNLDPVSEDWPNNLIHVQPEEDRREEVLEMIAEDMKNDAAHFDGQPFTGKTVATYFDVEILVYSPVTPYVLLNCSMMGSIAVMLA